MKKNKITFFAMELILLVLALFFVWKIFIQNVPEKRVAVILPESGDQRWDSLIKGMKQSAKENHIHLVICNTDDIENAEAEKEAIEEQKNNHIDAFIVLPAPGTDTKEMLTKECSDVPVILVVEDLYTEDAEATSKFSVVAPDYYEMGKYIGGQINSRKQELLWEGKIRKRQPVQSAGLRMHWKVPTVRSYGIIIRKKTRMSARK